MSKHTNTNTSAKTNNTNTLGMPGSHSHPPLCLTAAMIFNLSEHKNTTPRVVEMDMLSEKVYVGSP